MVISDPRDWESLACGSALQRKAFFVLKRNEVFSRLAEFSPAHVSSIGTELATERSDIDIVCSFSKQESFERALRASFGHCRHFSLHYGVSRGERSVVARFEDLLEVEVYGSEAPVEQQFGYRHYLVTARILSLAGDQLGRAVIARKREGMKTEPALAECLGLVGDPYLSVLELEALSDQCLRNTLEKAGMGQDAIDL